MAYPAQITVEVADILEASPLSSSRAIVSRPAVGADPALVFAGVGSAVVVLQSDPANGNLSHFGAAATARIDVSGLVRNIALIDDTVYVAANRAGLVRLARSGNVWAEDFRYALPANGQHDSEQAFCVKAWSYTVGQDSGTRVLVGTCDELGQGALYLFDPEAGSPKLAVATGLGEVWTIAVAEGLVAGKVTVLVGTACAGIRRYDLDPDATTIPAPTGSTVLTDRFIRDIAIDVQGAGVGRAFVAANRHGVGILSLSSNGISVANDPVPPSLQSGPPPQNLPVLYCNSLAFDPVSQRLVVGLGPWFRAEKQFGSDARMPVPCFGGVERTPQAQGVAVYNVSTNALIYEAHHSGNFPAKNRAAETDEVFIRRVSGSEYFIDRAGGDAGVHSYRGVFGLSGWSVGPADVGYEHAQQVSLVCGEEVLIQGGALYVSNEYAVSSYERTGSGVSMLAPASVVRVEPANTIAGFASSPARVYVSGFAGIHILDVEGPNRLDPQLGNPILAHGGRGLATRATLGLPLAVSSDGFVGPRWLVRVNISDEDARFQSGGVRLFNVGTASSATDPQVQEIASWLHRGDAPWGGLLTNAELRDVAIREGTTQYWYVSYGTGKDTTVSGTHYSGETHLGLLTLKVIAPPAGPLAIVLEDRDPIVLAAPGSWPWRVTYEPARQQVYVALGSQGVAFFDVSTPGNPVLQGHRSDFLLPWGTGTAYHAIAGPGTSVIVSCLDRGIAVIEDYQDIHSPVTLYQTRFQALGLAPDPADGTGRTFFAGDGRAGAIRFQLP